MSLISAKAAIRDLGTKAQAVVEDGQLTPAEKMARLDDYTAELKGYQDEIKVHETAKTFISAGDIADDAKSVEQGAPHPGGVWGEFVSGTDFKSAQLMAAGRKQFRVSTEIGLKASTIAEGTGIVNGQLNGNNGVLALPQYVPGIVDLRFAPLSVASLFAQGTTNTSIISYVKETTETQAAAAVAEAGLKPQADMTVVRLNEQVGKIAVFAKTTDEMIQDVDYIQSFLSSRLVNQVQREEENEVLNGTGYPALAGVLGRTGLQAPISAGVTGTIAKPMLLAEAIHQQITKIRTTAYFEPDAVVMNPIDWQYLQLAKDGQSQYYSGGPFTGSYGNGGYTNVMALWGFRVVLSNRIASGTALVGAFEQGGQLFRRQGIVVEMANQNQDDFINNLITIRAEERAALAIWRPNAFGAVTVTWA